MVLEIFKTLNALNPTCMQELSCLRSSSARWPNDIGIIRTNTNTYGTKSLRSLRPQIWNSLPQHIKVEPSLAYFWILIDTWFDKECLCNLRKHIRIVNSTNYQINQMLFRYGFLLLLRLVQGVFTVLLSYCN